ncbi:MAG: TAXI family TRAP transporter solute-binding subunit [Xanthobacteraceae bacterium]
MATSPKSIAVLVGAVTAALAAGTPAAAQMYGLGTGKQGFFTYSAGAAIAKVASDNGLALRIQPYGGTSAYVPAVNAKEIEFGLANELETNYAVTGKVIYDGKPQPDVRVVAILTPLYSVLHVRKDSPIKTIADLKGKRVPTDYVSQRVLDVLVKGTLANGGLSYDDIQKVPVPNVLGGANEFAEGKADTFMFALGSGAVAETDAKVGGLRVLPIDPSPEAMARMHKFIPVAYATKLEPAKGRYGILEPTMVYAYDYLVVVNKDVPDEAVYKLAKIMHDHKADLASGFGPLAGFMPDRMAKKMDPVQFHPGAIKYYTEIGAWPPKPAS